ncbi:MAG: hypothetical protein Q9216_001277 [Gyalolechia sp. 2 TL-2023]
MAPTVSTPRAFLELFIILCYLAQLLTITFLLCVKTAVDLVFANFTRLEPFFSVIFVLVSLCSLILVIAEIIVLIKSDHGPRSRQFVFVQCIKNLIWIGIVARLGYMILSRCSHYSWDSEWSLCIGWMAFGMVPFVASLLFTLSDGARYEVRMEKGTDEKTPLIKGNALEA